MSMMKIKSRNPEQALGFIPIEKSERICEKTTSGEFYISGAINEADSLLCEAVRLARAETLL